MKLQIIFREYCNGLEVVGPTLRLSLRAGDFTDTVARGFTSVSSMGLNQPLSGAEIFTDGSPIHMS